MSNNDVIENIVIGWCWSSNYPKIFQSKSQIENPDPKWIRSNDDLLISLFKDQVQENETNWWRSNCNDKVQTDYKLVWIPTEGKQKRGGTYFSSNEHYLFHKPSYPFVGYVTSFLIDPLYYFPYLEFEFDAVVWKWMIRILQISFNSVWPW